MGDALRAIGLDEIEVAENFAHVVDKLKGKGDKTGGVEKLLVDVLKDCARHLESSAPEPKSISPDAPIIVQLVHSVSRPARTLPPADTQASDSSS